MPEPSPELESAAIADGLTEDRWLGGRLVLVQPRRGHRVGTDAALLVAAAGDARQGRIVDVGAGVGAVGLALAQRNPLASVDLVELDPEAGAACGRPTRRATGFRRARASCGSTRSIPKSAARPGSRIGRLRCHQPPVLRAQDGSRLPGRRQSASACFGRRGSERDACQVDSGLACDSRARRPVRDDPPARCAPLDPCGD